jgi:diguanylate cyclase (GGDEF)-like protein
VLDDPRVMRRVGESALELSVGEGLKAALRALGTPALVFRNVVRANAKFNTVQGMELAEIGRDHARVRFVDLVGVGFHPLDCDYTAGLLSCVPALFGQPLGRVSHPACGVHGERACIYDISWSRHFSPMRTLVGTGAVSVGAVAGAASVAPALLPFALAFAAAAGGRSAWRMHRETRSRWERLEREAREHLEFGERLAASLQDLAGELRLDELLEKITRNAQSAVGGKEYALLVEDGGHLRCLGSSGLPRATLSTLERWLARPGGRLGEPILIEDVDVVEELAPIGLQEAMPLRSLCAVPLSYRGRTIGALVALAPQRRSFLPRDVDLLRSYAVQAAIALVNARLFEMQERLAAHDALTGLLNRRQLHEHLRREIDRCRRHGGGFSLVLLDLDGFKLVNDTGGHSAGDDVLRRVADALDRSTRGADMAFRMGGDEFALLLIGDAEPTGVEAAERAATEIGNADARVQASYGIARWPEDGPDDDALLAVADVRLYAMKESCRRQADSLQAAGAVPDCCPSQAERVAALSRLARRLARVDDRSRLVGVAIDELGRGFPCYAPLVAEGAAANGGKAPKTSLPIQVGDRVWGSLVLDTREHAVHDEDRFLLEAAVAQIGLTLEVRDLPGH